jgi:hypothetical protein
MSNLQKSPNYINYSAAYNAAYHDYDMSHDSIVAALGEEPKKYVPLNARHQVANLAHQNREAVANCGNNALIVYDAFIRGESNLFAAWAATQPTGSDAEYIISKLQAGLRDVEERQKANALYHEARAALGKPLSDLELQNERAVELVALDDYVNSLPREAGAW